MVIKVARWIKDDGERPMDARERPIEIEILRKEKRE